MLLLVIVLLIDGASTSTITSTNKPGRSRRRSKSSQTCWTQLGVNWRRSFGYFFLWKFDQPVPLLGLGLADVWQGQGLGNSMLQLLIADARAARCDGVELTTVTTNERAFRLYQRAGFEHVGEVANVVGDGRVMREHQMFLPLKPDVRPPVREFKPPVAPMPGEP